MDSRLVYAVKRVLQETHQEHLVESVIDRVLRAVREFHNRSETFVLDTDEATFQIFDCLYEDVLGLGSIVNLRKVVIAFAYTTDGQQLEVVKAADASDYFKGAEHEAYMLRLGSNLKVKATSPLAAVTLVYSINRQISRDNFDTWLTESQLDFAINRAIGETMVVIGDDAAATFLRQADSDLKQLIDSVEKF